MKTISAFISVLFFTATSILSYSINTTAGSIAPWFWATVDWFPPFVFFAWIKWLICHQVNWSIIKHTFSFFLS